MSDEAIVLCVLAGTVVVFVWNRLPVELVAVGAALTLAGTGVLEFRQAVEGFGDPTVVFIATLFVVSAALDTTGVTAWAGERLTAVAGGDRRRLLVATMALSAVLTAVISVNGAVAALLPMAVVLSLRQRLPTSQLLMPLAFAAHAGSLLALTGSPVNVLVSDASSEAGAGRFGFFEFALVGVPLLVGTIVITALLGPRLLPSRTPRTLPSDLSAHARTLCAQYLQGRTVTRLDVPVDADGRDMAVLRDLLPPELELVGVQVGDAPELADPAHLHPGDVLIVRGDPAEVTAFAAAARLEPSVVQGAPDEPILGRRFGVAEVVIPPRSALIGELVFPGLVTDSGDLVVLAVQRRGEDVGPDAVRLAVGDTLLLQGEWHALDREIDVDREVIAVDEPRAVRGQAVPLGPKSREAIGVTAAMVVLLATGVVPAAAAGLLAAGALVLLGVLSITQLYQSISWTTVVLVAGMIPVSTAMQVSGAADRVATGLVDLVGDAGPRFLLLGLFLLAAVVGSVLSNTAMALILLPIGVSAAAELDISAKPVVLAVGVSCSAAFLTPITTAANLMVMGPGGYRFGDYWKYGLPLLALYGAVVVFYIPLLWSF